MSHKTPLALLLVLTFLIGADYLSAWVAPSAVPPATNVAAPLNTSSASQIKAGGLGVASLDVVGGAIVRGTTNLTDVDMRVTGRVGAAEYCDVNGQNCFTADSLTTGETCNYETQNISGCQSAPACPAGWTAVGAPLRQVASCGTSSQHDRYTVTCGRNVCTGGGGASGWGTWTNVTASRPTGVWHRNTNSQGIMVFYYISRSDVVAYVSPTGTAADQVQVTGVDADSGERTHSNFIVPPGHYYRLSGGTMSIVAELRLPM